MWYHTNVVWNQADRNYDLRQICHSAFFKDRAKNVKVRHEKVAKNRQKWVQIFFGMSHMLNNDICNIFKFFTLSLLVLSRPYFWAILKKSAQKQGLESTKRKSVKNKKNFANVVIEHKWHPKKNLDPFLPVFSHFFMSYFDVFGSIF